MSMKNIKSGNTATGFKYLAVFLTLALLICTTPLSAIAEVAPPTALGAPAHFGAKFNYSNFKVYISAPDDFREYMARRVQDDPDNPDLKSLTLYYQVDAKINDGNWQYTSDWDSPKTVPDNRKYYIPCQTGEKQIYAGEGYAYIKHLFSDEALAKAIENAGWDYFKSNSITLRARLAQSFDYGKTFVLSPWSKEFVLSANVKLDTDKMINNAPTLKGAEVVMLGSTPHMSVKLEKPPQDIGELNVATGGSVRAEIWLRKKGDKEFKQVHYWWVSNESILFDVRKYFEDYKDSYEAAAFEVKTRYSLDLRVYMQANVNSTTSVDIYSPFSNVISHNMPAWSDAPSWAAGELNKAVENGLFPDRLKGEDLTKPITRAEFASVALKLYEGISKKTASPAPANTFTDTKDSDVLKAFALDIVAGTSKGINVKFEPDTPISREACAAMLTRVYKKIYWEGWTLDGDKTYTKHSLDNKDVPKFTDDADIFPNFKPDVYFMAKYGIILGDKGIFGPKVVNVAGVTKNFATRTQALLISNRTFEKADEIKDGGPVTAPAPSSSPAPSSTPAPTPTAPTSPTPSPVTPATPAPSGNNSNISEDWLIGTWVYSYSVGNVGLAIILEFREDGTFDKAIGTVSGYSYSATAFEGKYKVSDNKILFYEQKKSTAYASSSSELWRMALSKIKDIPVDNEEVEYSKSEEGNLVYTQILEEGQRYRNEYHRMEE